MNDMIDDFIYFIYRNSSLLSNIECKYKFSQIPEFSRSDVT